MQNDIDEWLGDRLVWGVLEAFHKKGILTRHMWPNPKPIEIAVGPTTLMLPIDLQKPEHDLAKALNLAPVVRKYVADAFGLPEKAHFDVQISQGLRYLLVTVPHPDPWYPSFLEVGDLAEDDLLLGIDTYSQIVRYNLWEPMATALVSGKPGSGKTNTMRLLVIQALAQGWKVCLIAAKGLKAGVDSSEWEDVAPYCHMVAVSHQESKEVLDWVSVECKARAEGKSEVDYGILLVVDELLEMSYEDQKDLGSLLRMRRSAGLRAFLGVKVVSKQVAQDIRASVGVRLAHTSASLNESQLATGIANLGAEKLRKGEAIMVGAGSRVTRLVVAKADTDDMDNLLMSLPEPAQGATSEMPEVKESTAFDNIIAQWIEVESASKRGLKAPPRWLLAKACAYTQRVGKLATFGLLRRWYQQRAEATLSDKRARMVRDAVATLLP